MVRAENGWLAKIVVCAAKSTIALLFIERGLREKVGAVQGCSESGAGYNHQANQWTTIYYRNVNMSNLHICKVIAVASLALSN